MEQPLRAIIVDDDESGSANLQSLITQYCKDIVITGIASSVKEASAMLRTQQPDVIFLDIRMPEEDGFTLLSRLPASYTPYTVFVTAYDQYAIRAIRCKAFDYLLKPIDIDELQDCVQRLIAASPNMSEALSVDDAGDKKIGISHARGTRIISLKDILYLEGDKNYTILHLAREQGTEKFVVSRTLGDFEGTLPAELFFRIHKSYIINFAHMLEHRNNDGGYVVMSNHRQIEISRRRSVLFRQFIHEHYQQAGKK